MLKLTITPTSENVTVPASLTFDVEGSFRNPSSGGLRSGFYVARADSSFSGFVEQSDDLSLNAAVATSFE